MPGPRPPPPVAARAPGPTRSRHESKPSTSSRRGPSRVRRGARWPRPPRPTRKASRKAVREQPRRWTRAPEVGPVEPLVAAAAARGSGGDGSTREAAPSGKRIAGRQAPRPRRATLPLDLERKHMGRDPALREGPHRKNQSGRAVSFRFMSWATASDGTEPGRIGDNRVFVNHFSLKKMFLKKIKLKKVIIGVFAVARAATAAARLLSEAKIKFTSQTII